MSVPNLKFLFYFFLVCIIALALFFPSNTDHASDGLYKASDLIAEAKRFRQKSKFPAATAMTYSFSVISGCVLGGIFIISKVALRRVIGLTYIFGRVRSFLYATIMFIVLYMIVFMERGEGTSEKSRLFLQLMSESRMYLAIWCLSIYLCIASSVVVFFASVIDLFFNRGIDEGY